MISVGIFEAKASLGQLVQSVAEGEVVLLTRRGKPVAELRAPEGEMVRNEAQQAIADLRRFRRNLQVGDFDLAECISEGRR